MFDLSNYEPVENRIKAFYEKYENGRIVTDLIAYSDNQFIVKTCVYRDAADTLPAATGLAEEKVGASPVNRTSALENCETSSIGRALANLNFATKLRPSAEEMSKVNAYKTAGGDVPREDWKDTAAGKWAEVGAASDKQLKFVYSIVLQAFKDAGYSDSGINYSLISSFLQSDKAIEKLEDINKKQASAIINDKANSAENQSKLIKFLQDQRALENSDPWKEAKF